MTHFLSITWNGPKGIDFGFYTLHYYSIMFVIAFSSGWYIMKKIYDREGESQEKLDKLFVYTIVATMIGARLGHVLFYQPELFRQDPVNVFLPIRLSPKFEFTGFEGLASHGAAIAVIIIMIWYSKKVIHRPLLWVLDRIALPIAAGGIFVRIGNFLNSEILGSPVSAQSAVGVRFIKGEEWLNDYSVVRTTHEENVEKAYTLIEQNPDYQQVLDKIPYRHPAQLYEAFLYIFVFAIVYYMYWKTDARRQHGLIFGVFLVLLWSVRFGVEYVKESQGGFESALNYLSTGQWLSIPFILAGIYLIATAKKRTATL